MNQPSNYGTQPILSPLKIIEVAAPAPGPVRAEEATFYDTLDRFSHAGVAKATAGLSPSVLAEAWMDWAIHLGMSPGKQLQLMESALRNGQTLWAASLRAGSGTTSPTSIPAATPASVPDRRFTGDGWQKYPFNVLSQAHRQNWQWWQEVMTGVHGVSPTHENLMAFVAGLLVDTSAPSNFALTNPDVLAETVTENGQNLVRGAQHLLEDSQRKAGTAQAKARLCCRI